MLPRGSTELWSVLENSMMMEEVLLVFHNQAINGGSTKFFWQLWGTFMMKTMIISPTKSFWEASAVYSFLLSLHKDLYQVQYTYTELILSHLQFVVDVQPFEPKKCILKAILAFSSLFKSTNFKVLMLQCTKTIILHYFLPLKT